MFHMAASPVLSPAKVVLLAVRFASRADTESLHLLKARYDNILGNEVILRILLTYLPETTPPSAYTGFVQKATGNDELQLTENGDISPDKAVLDMDEAQAIKKVKKLSLLELSSPKVPAEFHSDIQTMFLFRRAHKMDEEAGMLNHVTELLGPFAALGSLIPIWMSSTVLPLSRRNLEYYVSDVTQSLASFQELTDRAAVEYLLSQTGAAEGGHVFIGRDLRGILSPFLHSEKRWASEASAPKGSTKGGQVVVEECAGWNQAMDWLLSKAAKSWSTAIHAIEQWDGPCDVDFGDYAVLPLPETRSRYLDHTYTKAILASIYSILEQNIDAIEGAHRALSRARVRTGFGPLQPLADIAEQLPDIPPYDFTSLKGPKSASACLRNDLLKSSNMLTEPDEGSLNFATGLIISAFILTTLGIPSSVRNVGDLTLLQDHREQKGELLKLIRLVSNHTSRNSDDYWARARRQILWLQRWGSISHDQENKGNGVFGMVSAHDVETELLKAMLTHGRYSLAKSLYEDSNDHNLNPQSIEDAVYQAALDAFDNASNPNRTKGGLRRCNDILHALPKLVPKSRLKTKQIESLLDAAHALSSYRLVLKQGEAFSPVVLRVHSDPILIIEKVLEQNPGAYTRLQEFLEIGRNMVVAGFLSQGRSTKRPGGGEDEDRAIEAAGQRIVAFCISGALEEDDFETAYSYVVSRLGGSEQTEDEWSWKAALKAGQYTRTAKTQQPTHLGTSSGNPEIRHLEQRLECLSTALRVAPAPQLQGILEGFRDCEEQLDAAIADEAAKDAAWDSAGDMSNIPGSFDTPTPETAYPPRNITAAGAARQAEETPMSLFDLSRATARVAQRNFTSLSSLNDLAHGGAAAQVQGADADGEQQRQRKRDQLREAATGTLVSGVGWLLGANPNRDGQ